MFCPRTFHVSSTYFLFPVCIVVWLFTSLGHGLSRVDRVDQGPMHAVSQTMGKRDTSCNETDANDAHRRVRS